MTLTQIADTFESFLRNKFQSSDDAEEALRNLRSIALHGMNCKYCKHYDVDSDDDPCASCFSSRDYFEPR